MSLFSYKLYSIQTKQCTTESVITINRYKTDITDEGKEVETKTTVGTFNGTVLPISATKDTKIDINFIDSDTLVVIDNSDLHIDFGSNNRFEILYNDKLYIVNAYINIETIHKFGCNKA